MTQVSKLFFVTIVSSVFEFCNGAVTLRPKAIQHPFPKACELIPTEIYDHFLLMCSKTFHVFLKNLRDKNVTPWLFCLPEPYMALYLLDEKQKLVVCKQATVQNPTELLCEQSPLSPRNLKCEDTYVFDEQLPSTSSADYSKVDTMATADGNDFVSGTPQGCNQPYTSETSMDTMLMNGVLIMVITVLFLISCSLIFHMKCRQKPSTQRALTIHSNEYLVRYCPTCGVPKQGTAISR